MPLVFAEFGNVGETLVKILAIAGGFLVGYLLTHLILRLVARLVLKKRMPGMLERALQVIGGLIVAFLVALLVFGEGGWGLGGPGGGRPGGPGGDSKQQPGHEQKEDPKTPPSKKSEESVPFNKVTVTVMKASPSPAAFRFENDGEVVGIAKAKQKLDTLKAGSQKTLTTVELRIYLNSTGEGNDDVREFRRYADRIGLPNTVQKPDEKLPE